MPKIITKRPEMTKKTGTKGSHRDGNVQKRHKRLQRCKMTHRKKKNDYKDTKYYPKETQ